MKIALIDPSLFTWPYDHALAAGMAEHGGTVALITKYLAANEQGAHYPFVRQLFYPGFQLEAVKKLPHKLFLALKGLMHIFSMIRLWFYLQKMKPDVIHFQWTPLAVIDQFFIPWFRKIAPTILTVHDSSPFNNNPSAQLQRLGAIKIMGRFDHLIVHTQKARQALIGYGLDAQKISLIAHGVLESEKTGAPAVPHTEDKVSLLLFGQVKPYKGTDLLIAALAELPPATRAKCRLDVVGKPQMEMQPLFDQAHAAGVTDTIRWELRFVDEAEIHELFENADIMVMPYREIDASGVLMLALSVGKPIVATRIGLFAEILEDGVHGYLIPQDDAHALAQALVALIEDKALRVRMGDQVALLGNTIPGWQDIGKTTMDLYRSLPR